MVSFYLGTMGFSYKDWERVFYPVGTSPRNYLRHYSKYFNAVEIDSTFYGTPRLKTIEQWAAITPKNFQICVKTPRKITHELMLDNALDEMREFIRVIKKLGRKLGVILIQFPPSFSFGSYYEKLEDFLSQMRARPEASEDIRFAVEFRHISWHTRNTAQMLEKYHVCWAATEYPQMPGEIYRTTEFLYIRWIGQHGTYPQHDQERVDKTSQLEQWWQRIDEHIHDIGALYGFFNNDYSGHAPVTCNKFKNIVGLPTKNIKPPQQQRLF